jgi:hypothetical protein
MIAPPDGAHSARQDPDVYWAGELGRSFSTESAGLGNQSAPTAVDPCAYSATRHRRSSGHLVLQGLVAMEVCIVSRWTSDEICSNAILDALPKLLAIAATQTARLANLSELASQFELSRPTIRNYLTLIERLFLVEYLPPWFNNRAKRLIRDKDGYEVDVVVQRGSRYVGIEVKAANSVHEGDFRGIKRLRELLESQFHAGIVLYDGEHVLPFGDQLLAVPLSALWASKSTSAGKRKPVTRRATPPS